MVIINHHTLTLCWLLLLGKAVAVGILGLVVVVFNGEYYVCMYVCGVCVCLCVCVMCVYLPSTRSECYFIIVIVYLLACSNTY